MHIQRLLQVAAVSATLGLTLPPQSWGEPGEQAAGKAKGAIEVEEVTVVAQKREENLQEVPISVTALSNQAMEQRGLHDVLSLTEAVPGLHATATFGSTQTAIAIRGVGSAFPNMGSQTVAGMYVDGVYIPKTAGNNFDLEDLDHIEVLRGPQGTLYGRNTIAGAVSFITKKPTEERSIALVTEAGNFNYFKGRMTVNIPLVGKNGFLQSDALGTVSLRQNAMYKSRDGFRLNQSPTNVPASGGREFDDARNINNMTALRWQPNKKLTVDYAFEYHRYKDTPSEQLTDVTPNAVVSLLVPNVNAYVARNRADAFGNDAFPYHYNGFESPADFTNTQQLGTVTENRMHILTAAYDLGEVGPLGSATVKSIAAYRYLSMVGTNDLDGTPLNVLSIAFSQPTTSWSEELQWIGALPRLNYVLGAFYYGERTSNVDANAFVYQSIVGRNQSVAATQSYAPYGQVTWTPPVLGDRLSLTAGLRYTVEQVHATEKFSCQREAGKPCSELDWSVQQGKNFSTEGAGLPALSPMANLSYQATDDIMAYGRVSRGYRSGGFNLAGQDQRAFVIPFKPEVLRQYELGFKSRWLDNRLEVNAAGYYSDYKDKQENVVHTTPTGNYPIAGNAESAEVWGTELEVVAAPVRGITVNANYALALGTYKEWETQATNPDGSLIFNPDGTPVLTNVSSQRRFAYVPPHQANVGLTYTAPPTSAGTFSAHVDVYWQDQQAFTPEKTTTALAMDGWNYALVNGRLQFAQIPLQRGSLDLAVFGNNLFDRKYRSWGTDFGAFGYSLNVYGPPRTFGLQLAYNFTAGEAAPPPRPPVAQAAPPPPPPAKKKIVLRSVHFDFDKATLKAEARPILDEAVQVLKEEGSVDIVVEGHTDSVGSDQYNLGLSRRRGETVRSYLVDHGIARSRITAEGMGEAKPVASNDTADGRAQNRRVELHVE